MHGDQQLRRIQTTVNYLNKIPKTLEHNWRL